MRKKVWAALLLTACVLAGCAKGETETAVVEQDAEEMGTVNAEQDAEETETVNTEEKTAEPEETADVSSAEEESLASDSGETAEEESEGDWIFFVGNHDLDFSYLVDYDYVFYVKGFYLSADGQSDEIYIQPIEWVWKFQTEEWIAWGNDPDEGPYYDYRDDNEEILCIPLSETVEFHFYNWWDDPYLYEITDAYSNRECVTTDPKIFLYYKQTYYPTHSETDVPGMADYPFFMILDENGCVQYIIEHTLM